MWNSLFIADLRMFSFFKKRSLGYFYEKLHVSCRKRSANSSLNGSSNSGSHVSPVSLGLVTNAVKEIFLFLINLTHNNGWLAA
jgi:hypothetical protein